MTVADMFRPAMFVSWPPIQNRRIAPVVTLVRLAVNLGLAAGPALDLIIMNIGYRGLFWVDGTCIVSILIFTISERT
jgi:hypothetical protein